jgi:hypothetical protein
VTHYDALGAERTATAAELREAFRRAARAAHPDRHGEESAQRMAAVNAAWHVLGDADRRRRYDAELDAIDREEVADQSPARRTPAAPPAPPPAERYDPARFPWRFMAGLLSVGVALVVAGVIVYDPPPPAGPDGILRPGDCVTLSAILEAVEVTCGQHDAVVERLIPVDQTCPADTQPYRDQQGMGTACVVRSEP